MIISLFDQSSNMNLKPDNIHFICMNPMPSLLCAFACIDVNECEVFKNERGGPLCAHVCVNVPGSYHCSCPTGYKLLADGRSCEGETQTFVTFVILNSQKESF